MAEAVFMPKQGQSVETCIITQWYKKKGDKVSPGDLLFAYETDKAAFEEEAKLEGILLEVFYNEGDEVPVLSNVAVIGSKGESTREFIDGPEQTTQSVDDKNEAGVKKIDDKAAKKSAAGNGDDKKGADASTAEDIRISPRARKMAKENGISLSIVSATGPNGRIIVRDIEDYMNSQTKEGLAAQDLSASQKKTVPSSHLKLTESPDAVIKALSNVRKIIAKNMLASLQNSAQLTHHISADARAIMKLRNQVKEGQHSENIPNITLNDMVSYALVKTLLKLPEINAHFSSESIKYFKKVHLGMAVDTDRGLMVPVLRDADDYSLRGLSNKLKELAQSCRSGKIDPGLLQPEAGSFTISNLGAYGIEMFTPVLNLPQIGILGVNTITYRPGDTGDGTIGFIPVIGLSLTYDHRAIDGAPASNFLKELKNAIENFEGTLD